MTNRSGSAMEDQDIQPTDNPTALRIVDAAAQLFMQRGYTAVSITDIIRAAGVTKPTLYYYFTDKEELFLHTGLRVLATMGAEMSATLHTPGDFRQRLLALADAMMHDGDRDMRMMRHEMWEHLGPDARKRLAHAFFQHLFAPVARLMDEGLRSGDLAGYPPHILTTMFMGMSEAFQEYGAGSPTNGWAERGEVPTQTSPLSSTHMVDMFLHGAGGPRARRDTPEGAAAD